MDNRTMRKKQLRETLQEIVNANTVKAVGNGFAEIDRHAATAKKKLKGLGIEGLDELVDGVAKAVKRKAAELATGRHQ